MSHNSSRNDSSHHSKLNESKENEINTNFTNSNMPPSELIWVSREFEENFDIDSLKNIPKFNPRIGKIQDEKDKPQVKQAEQNAERIKQEVIENAKSKYVNLQKANVFITKNCNIVISILEGNIASVSALKINKSFKCDEEIQKHSDDLEELKRNSEYEKVSEFYFDFLVKEKEEIREPLADLKNLKKYDEFFIEELSFESQNKNNTDNLVLIIETQLESDDKGKQKFKITYTFDQIKKFIEQGFLLPKKYFSQIFPRNESKEEQPKQDQKRQMKRKS